MSTYKFAETIYRALELLESEGQPGCEEARKTFETLLEAVRDAAFGKFFLALTDELADAREARDKVIELGCCLRLSTTTKLDNLRVRVNELRAALGDDAALSARLHSFATSACESFADLDQQFVQGIEAVVDPESYAAKKPASEGSYSVRLMHEYRREAEVMSLEIERLGQKLSRVRSVVAPLVKLVRTSILTSPDLGQQERDAWAKAIAEFDGGAL